MKPKLEAILFDMGGTLIEFENLSWDVLNQRCAREGYGYLKSQNLIGIGYQDFVDSLAQEFEKRWAASEKTLQEIAFESVAFSVLKKLNLNVTDGNKKEFMSRYYQPVTDQITLIHGAVDTLKFFKGRNIKVGLLSNTIFPKRFHLQELNRLGLTKYIDAAIFSSEVGFRKPHPMIFQTALEILSTDPEFASFVGDRMEEDIGGARQVGMKTVLIIDEKKESSGKIVPDAEINNLTELPAAVVKLFDM